MHQYNMFNGTLRTVIMLSIYHTGKFSVKSTRGNLYIFVLYHYDTNSIHVMVIPNCQAATIRNSWQQTYNTLLSKEYQFQHNFRQWVLPRSNISFCSTKSTFSLFHWQRMSQRIRTCNLHIQKPFHCNTQHCWLRFPTSRVGYIAPTCGHHFESSPFFSPQPIIVSTCIPFRQLFA